MMRGVQLQYTTTIIKILIFIKGGKLKMEQNQFEKGNGKRLTQYDRVLMYLKEKGSITSLQAIRLFGATRLSAIIYNLRNDGYNITNETITKQNRYGDKVHFAKYILKGEN